MCCSDDTHLGWLNTQVFINCIDSLIVLILSPVVGVWCDHVGNHGAGADPLPRCGELRDLRVPH